MTTVVDLQRPCTCGDLLVQHRDGKCWVVPGVGAFCKCPEYKEACECGEHTGVDCLTHKKPWDGDEECGR